MKTKLGKSNTVPVIEVEELTKVFKIRKKEPGLGDAVSPSAV
jgi:hypothetical protein